VTGLEITYTAIRDVNVELHRRRGKQEKEKSKQTDGVLIRAKCTRLPCPSHQNKTCGNGSKLTQLARFIRDILAKTQEKWISSDIPSTLGVKNADTQRSTSSTFFSFQLSISKRKHALSDMEMDF
jgi:hypothetical protein